jgi:hypothetical protein
VSRGVLVGRKLSYNQRVEAAFLARPPLSDRRNRRVLERRFPGCLDGHRALSGMRGEVVQPAEERQLVGAKNQALFREVNERIKGVAHSGYIEFLCECADTDCTERIRLSSDEYEAIRRYPERFPIMPGHEVPEIEVVVEKYERYIVVEKIELAAQAARKLNPRARGVPD